MPRLRESRNHFAPYCRPTRLGAITPHFGDKAGPIAGRTSRRGAKPKGELKCGLIDLWHDMVVV